MSEPASASAAERSTVARRPPVRLIVRRLWIPVVVFGIYSLFFYRAIADLPPRVSLYPMILIGIVAILITVITVGAIRAPAAAGEEANAVGSLVTSVEGRRQLYAVAWLAAYIYAIPGAGFLVASSVFAAGLMLSLGLRRPLLVAVIVAAAAIVSHLLFIEILRIPLPQGTWWEA